jgi:hypothetical protein
MRTKDIFQFLGIYAGISLLRGAGKDVAGTVIGVGIQLLSIILAAWWFFGYYYVEESRLVVNTNSEYFDYALDNYVVCYPDITLLEGIAIFGIVMFVIYGVLSLTFMILAATVFVDFFLGKQDQDMDLIRDFAQDGVWHHIDGYAVDADGNELVQDKRTGKYKKKRVRAKRT